MTELPIVVNMTVDASRTEYDLTAESNLEEIELLNDTVIETGGSHVPVYEGPYTVDAGLTAVTLDTDGKRMTQDVTVNALQAISPRSPSISVNSDNGRVTATAYYPVGYNDTAFVIPTVHPLPTQGTHTYTPSNTEQTILAKGTYITGNIKVGAIPTGTRGTPTATKGTVSNHSVSVTPSVTNTTGYIEGGTKTGNAVSVSASELVSGNKAITQNGNNIDVANYSTVSVNVPTVTPTGEISITQNGTYDVTNYASAEVNVSGGNPADQYVTAQSIQFHTSIPTDFYAYYPKATSFQGAFYNLTLTNQNSITLKSDSYVTSLASFMNSRSISEDCVVTLDMDLSKCTSYNAAFGPRISTDKTPRVIVANLDFSSVTSATNANAFNGNRYVTTLTFVPNTLKVNFPISSASGLTNATLVSLANCLVAGSHTLTLNETPKANLSTIMGTVTNNGTYDIFTESASGDTTLLSFITTTKGWTVA